jgi:hypothetical protein
MRERGLVKVDSEVVLVVAVDPGAVTGLAWGVAGFERGMSMQDVVESTHRHELPLGAGNRGIWTREIEGSVLEQAEAMATLINGLRWALWEGYRSDDFVLVIEKFIGGAGFLKPGAPDVDGGKGKFVAVEVAWALLAWRKAMRAAWERERNGKQPGKTLGRLEWIAPADAHAVSDQQLRNAGLWVRGRDHQRAATRLWARWAQKELARLRKERSGDGQA